MSDTWIRAGRAAVIVVALITAAISFTHIRDLALAHGGDSLTSPLLPLAIDGAVAAFTVFMHQASGLALWLSRCGLLLAIGMTVAFNTAYGATDGTWGAVIWSCPALLLVICIEVSVLTVRKGRPEVTEGQRNKNRDISFADTPAAVAEPEVTPAVTMSHLKPLTRQQQADAIGVNIRKLYRMLDRGELPELVTNGNGKAH